MFDPNVVNEGVGQATVAEYKSSLQGSPDGLGAYVQPEPGDQYGQQQHTYQQPQPQQNLQPAHHQHPQMAGEIDFIEPDSTSDGAAVRSAGFTLLFVALGTGVGYALKGGLGACAGLLLCGGAANAYRAQKWFDSGEPSEKHEALVSTVFAVAEIGAGGYVAWKAIQANEKKSSKRDRD